VFYRPAEGFKAGDLKFHGRTALPGGWLWCDGAAVSRTTYAALFAAIASAFGAGDGSTTFNTPDLRGRVAAGKDNMGQGAASRLTTAGSGVDGATLGAVGGAQNVTLAAAAIPAHTHTLASGSVDSQGDHTHSLDALSRLAGAETLVSTGSLQNVAAAMGAAGAHTHNMAALSLNNTGGGGAHNSVPPAQVFNFIIKT
jgi:microcystin-dependent protein